MSVKIVAITQPKEDLNPQEFVAYVARVSNPENQNNKESAPKLLKYLIKNQHWSPFELVNIVMEIETPRDIARQIIRHPTLRPQEFSQRYAIVESPFVLRELRMQDKKNRQNSVKCDNEDMKQEWIKRQNKVAEAAEEAYKWAIDNGVAKEVARVVLPEGMTLSRLYMNGSLRSWITYIALREKNGTQEEHKLIAKECKELILKEFPFLEVLNNESGDWII